MFQPIWCFSLFGVSAYLVFQPIWFLSQFGFSVIGSSSGNVKFQSLFQAKCRYFSRTQAFIQGNLLKPILSIDMSINTYLKHLLQMSISTYLTCLLTLTADVTAKVNYKKIVI